MSTSSQSVTPDRLYLEDLHVGQRFTSRSFELDEEQIRAFARQFDPQPFHLDPVAAGETFFGGLAASGWHTAAITMRLLVEGLPIAGGLIGGGGEITWPRPTRPGAVLHVESQVVEVTPSRSRPERGMALVRSETINQFGEVVQILISRLVVPRRTAPPQSR
jgi:acyl dehydratase